MRRYLPLLSVLLLALIGLGFVLLRDQEAGTEPALPVEPSHPIPSIPLGPSLSNLASPPDWGSLEIYQNTLSTKKFEELLRTVYALPHSWEEKITLDSSSVTIQQSYNPEEQYLLQTQEELSDELAPLPPLDQIHIAIDPGHIGGDFAELEQRSFDPTPEDPTDIPVREGDLSLATAKLLKSLLEEMGAQVSLVRETAEPVTEARPENFLADFGDRNLANKIFYRTAEIRARADLVNHTIQPDLILCLHYNAEAWNDPSDPWSPENHFHIILNGAYMPQEVKNDDQRFEMVRNLLSRSTERALPLAQTISDVFLRETDLIPFNYSPSAPALLLDPVRPIWARNLLANRLYEAPTIFMEPYIMNNREVHHRVQLGDYEGLQDIDGEEKPSLIREYAETLAQAIAEYYENRVDE